MTSSFASETSTVLAAVGKLFDEKPPILAEIRFPRMGTSSDWSLCEDAVVMGAILDRVGAGVEVHLNSVWDLKNPAGPVVVRKKEQAGHQPHTDTDCAVVGSLFDEKAPVLVETRFLEMGTSSDWALCEDAAAFNAIFERLSAGGAVHLSSVWDLTNPDGAIVLRPNK